MALKSGMGYFMGLNKVASKILQDCLNSDNLCKLLYYNESNPLSQPALKTSQKMDMIDKKITITPTVPFTDEQGSFIIIAFSSFELNDENPKFLDQTFDIDVFSHRDLWRTETGLRPFLMLHEIHQILEESNVFGVGRVKFLSGGLSLLTPDVLGYTVKYRNVDFDRR